MADQPVYRLIVFSLLGCLMLFETACAGNAVEIRAKGEAYVSMGVGRRGL